MLAAATILLAEDENDNIEDIAAFILLLEHRLRLRYCHKVNKRSLSVPEHSAWRKVLSAQHDGTFVKKHRPRSNWSKYVSLDTF